MKRTSRLFGLVMAVVLVFTSFGAVFADDAPPPVEDQSLFGPRTEYPDGDFGWNNGFNFQWHDVAGADKYILELQYDKSGGVERNYVNVMSPVTILPLKGSLIPATTYTITTKKPFSKGDYRWQVTAINTDVGIEPSGVNASSGWRNFSQWDPWFIKDMFPGDYSGKIDYKKGDGTNTNTPKLNWVVGYAGSTKYLENPNPWNHHVIAQTPGVYFKVTLTQGKNKYTKTVASTATCADYAYSHLRYGDLVPVGGDGTDEEYRLDALCSTTFDNFTPALVGLAPGLPYTWEVATLHQPFGDEAIFPIPSQIISTGKDTLQYNPGSDNYSLVSNAVVSDTLYTNKPTFRWNQASALPDKGSYQLLVEGYDPSKDPEKNEYRNAQVLPWKKIYAVNIFPDKTLIPGTKTKACQATLSEPCSWVFAAPFKANFNYRWNIRVVAGSKYGPWVNPGGVSLTTDDMVRNGATDFIDKTINYENVNGAFNTFGVPSQLSTPPQNNNYNWIINNNYYNFTDRMFTCEDVGHCRFNFMWQSAKAQHRLYRYDFDGNNPIFANYYQINLTRISPSPLTIPTKTISVERSVDEIDGWSMDTDCKDSYNDCQLNLNHVLPSQYLEYGLPRGVYQWELIPKLRLGGQDNYSKPVVKSVSRIVVGPNYTPSIIGVTYTANTQKMVVGFEKDTSVDEANVKYRILVKMKVGKASYQEDGHDVYLYRWIKVGSFAGTNCEDSSSNICELEFKVYQPGTKKALENKPADTYVVQIEEALKDEGNTSKPALNNKWGPFGFLSNEFSVPTW